MGAPSSYSQGRSHPKVKVKSCRNQPDIAVLCSASSNVSVDLGKTTTRRRREARLDRCGRADGRCHRVSGPTIRRGGVGSTSPGTFVLDAEFVLRWVVEAAARIDEQRDFLTQLDAAIGDADHGVNMQRGFAAAVATLQSSSDRSPGSLLEEVGKTLVYRVGGAAGPLYGTGFRRIGETVSEAVTPDGEVLLSALRAGLEGIQALGAAAAGDKTMVDAWEPAVAAFERTLRTGGVSEEAARNAAEAANAGVEATLPMQARKGRASYLGSRSIGHQDPGATSTALIFGALERAVRRAS
jgi:dihydroxyacetone kinase-like protein